MEKSVEKVKEILSGYPASAKQDPIKAAADLISAVSACQEYIEQNSRNDRGCAQRIVRDLDELLKQLPSYGQLCPDPQTVHRIHNRQLAQEYMEMLIQHLDGLLGKEEDKQKKFIHKWVRKHPVFQPLKELISKKLPKGAYILLFRQAQAEKLELVTQSDQEGRVYTRSKSHDFRDDLKLYKLFHGQPPVVGAAVIAERDLLAVIGSVPDAEESQDQIQALISISSQAAAKPAKEFVDENAVLKELHNLAHRRKIPRDAYILLFQNNPQDNGDPNLQIVVRTASDGKVVSRYWSVDFAIKHKLFDSFKGQPEIVGAAVIKQGELLKALGNLPQPVDGQTQLDALTAVSNTAIQKPFLNYIDSNIALKGLHELAEGQHAPRDAQVVIFMQGSQGKLEIMPLADSKGRRHSRIPLAEFQSARAVHDRFVTQPAVAGASVIVGPLEPVKSRPLKDKGKFDSHSRDKGKFDSPSRHAQSAGSKPVVVAAFGRTPLKINLLATSEIFQRLGINLF